MKIIVIADIHGEIEILSKFVEKIRNEDFDLIVFPGDFTEMSNIPEGFNQIDVAEIIIQKLLALNKPLFCVPGNHEPYEVLELLVDYGINIHNEVKALRNFSFFGFGGASTPFNTKFEPTEEEISQSLESISKKIKGPSVLVTHSPPKNTKVDKTESGEHVGSEAVRRFIEKHSPVLAISAHIHESGGIDRVGKTTIFYPGPLYDNVYGFVELDKKHVKCEIRKF
jgi:Icc-related predicted phosphoesterase